MSLKSTIAKRVFFGTVMTGFLTALLVGDGWLSAHDYFVPSVKLAGLGFVVMVAAILGAGAVELTRLAGSKGTKIYAGLIVPAVILLSAHPLLYSRVPGTVVFCWVLFGGMLIAALVQWLLHGTEGTLANLGATCFSIIYLGVGGWFLVSIRLVGRAEPGVWGQIGPVVMFLACVKSCDIGAYFTGRIAGRHKMVPSISPGKTWEGLFGGIVLAVVAGWFFAWQSDIMRWVEAVFFAITVAVSGQLGDLLESMLKRDAGSKDSAGLVPEFGGVLDILDSPLVAAPIAYMFFVW